ncbi:MULTISPECIES: hypothetical protein [Roseovarius]|uniref:Lipoprotein n=1 Tax=Roseovarius nubinhibens (strain ATCC BAA-591 / DSM 15170 / ISM) TaxID=89187 RepID=A3SPI4_ROSNI|nr:MULTISPECIES: hypothetical protein [Roseovarius]EAP76374.1 hypothetical protein ISM_15950 [Roseovarius nubinhibens ISM]|tara:strand:- start:5 stop:136 length:132 start_codon:yes stop_codon:yes gene_type:complete
MKLFKIPAVIALSLFAAACSQQSEPEPVYVEPEPVYDKYGNPV